MRIEVKLSDNGQLYLKVYSEDTTELTSRISSYNTNKVEQPIVNEVHNLVMEVGRYNGLSDTDIVKHFVENTLTEREIKILFKK